MRLEIVTHCYHYPRVLRYQLSSLALWPPSGVEITMTVCFTPEDAPTGAVLRWFGGQMVPGVRWNWQAMEPRELCRRSIGRNRTALATEADWVWFCDADYWFGAECWAAFAALPPPRKPIIYPRQVWMHRWRSLGDACIAAADGEEGLLSAKREDFVPIRMRRAIGGIQIASGEMCRKRGYLRSSRRWQTPPKRAVFQKCREDLFFRKEWGTAGQGIDLPGVYRIRHSRNGRDDAALRL